MSAIAGIGVDAIEPERIARALSNPRFAQRVYTPSERAHIDSAGAGAAQRAAGLFAAKEAAVKALGCGFDGVGFHEVEVAHSPAGQPLLRFSGRALERMAAIGGVRAHLSISHIESVAVAFVVIEGEGGGLTCRLQGLL